MGARKLTRWQKASALVPMAILVGAWAGAVGSGLANASSGISASDIPDVPSTPFEQPASVLSGSLAGIDDRAGAAGTISTLSTSGIPAASLAAYRRAETLLGKADPSCHLPWTLIAAIGRVESNHGRSNGNTVDAKGVSTPGVFGVPLTGQNGTAKISDTDSGAYDNDAVYDRAVGPMQFLPATWKSVGVDADGDGKRNPQDIDDAAAAAGVYLCAGTGDLSTKSGASAAVLRYNHSSSYVDLVLKIADAYAQGDFTQSPNGYGSSSVLTSKSNDQTLTPKQRDKAETDQNNSDGSTSGGTTGGGTSGGGTTGGGTTGGGTTGGGTTGGGTTGGGTTSGGTTITGTLGDALNDTPLAPVTKPVTDLLSTVEAQLQCTLKFPLGPKSSFDACVYDLTH